MEINKVLLVDDDKNVRLIVQMSLEGEWDLVIADSGQKALELAQSEMPDLILLDMMMPGMDGRQTLSKLKDSIELAKIPVIFMTAKVQSHEVEEYLKLGVAGLITKPFDPLTLADEIRQIVKRHES